MVHAIRLKSRSALNFRRRISFARLWAKTGKARLRGFNNPASSVIVLRGCEVRKTG